MRLAGCRCGAWLHQLRESVEAFMKRHPSARPERGREGILAAARGRLPADVKLLGLRMLQKQLGVSESS